MVPGYAGGQGRTGTSESIRSKPTETKSKRLWVPTTGGIFCQSRTHTMAYTMVNRGEGRGKGVLSSLMNGARKRKHTQSVTSHSTLFVVNDETLKTRTDEYIAQRLRSWYKPSMYRLDFGKVSTNFVYSSSNPAWLSRPCIV